ncbi:MAG: Bacterial domain [Candidatus Methanomethylophilaceae archaeon]|nr:Bacterial domain [Candidatus Methanomethylophilaceae archaeon]
MADSVYRTKRGLWYYLAPLFAVVIAVAWFLALDGWIWAVVCVATIAVMLFVFAAATYVYRRTSYTVTATSVTIDSTDGRIDIAFSKITSVDTEKDDRSAFYGMSGDIVRIKFGSASSVIISPARKEEFLEELRRAGLNVVC